MSRRRAASILLLAAACAGSITWIALEAGEVAVLHTRGGDGSARSTRVWVVEQAGGPPLGRGAFRSLPA